MTKCLLFKFLHMTAVTCFILLFYATKQHKKPNIKSYEAKQTKTNYVLHSKSIDVYALFNLLQ